MSIVNEFCKQQHKYGNHSTEKSVASFPLYRGCGSFSYVNEESSGLIVIGFGVGITFFKFFIPSFRPQKHFLVI